LLLVSLEEEPSLFTPYLREIVKLPSFIKYTQLVHSCLDDAAEISSEPFVELLETEPGTDKELWERQLACLKILERLDIQIVENLKVKLAKHPSNEIRRRISERVVQGTIDIIRSKRGGYNLIKIPGGNFIMGAPQTEGGREQDKREEPLHEVKVSGFYMGQYPVTNREYGIFLKENPDIKEPKYWGDRKFNQLNQPVVGVSWEDAHKYARWSGLRLPTEARWEYACRAGTSRLYYTGHSESDLDKAGWYNRNSGNNTHPIGQKEPNLFGLYDMHGNIWEWCEDDWHDNYNKAPGDGSAWIDTPRGLDRVSRGGSGFDNASNCRSANRAKFGRGGRYLYVGFRLIK